MIEVLAPGPLATVQDLGRPGYAALGVGRSGAADPASHRLANRLVGNAESAATIEVTVGGLRVRAHRDVLVAVTGAPLALDIGGRAAAMNGPLPLTRDDVLTLAAPVVGLRSYLAVRGGVDVPPVLGSRSTDLLSGLGPEPLRAGDRLPVGHDVDGAPLVDVAPVPDLPAEPVLRIRPGPRRDWFDDRAWVQLTGAAYTVESASNRIAVRLSGPLLARAVHRELASEPVLAGAVQVPSGGAPLVFLADHPVTGGYPVIAVVHAADLGAAAQLRPGQRVRFAADQRSSER